MGQKKVQEFCFDETCGGKFIFKFRLNMQLFTRDR